LITDTRIKEGIFVGAKKNELMNYRNLYKVLGGTVKTVWEAFILVFDNFLDNHKVPSYRQLVEQMLDI
jgi:hypothetical protein